jgi:hypothetical protein
MRAATLPQRDGHSVTTGIGYGYYGGDLDPSGPLKALIRVVERLLQSQNDF